MIRLSLPIRILGAAGAVAGFALFTNGCFWQAGCADDCTAPVPPYCAEGQVSTPQNPCVGNPNPQSNAAPETHTPVFDGGPGFG